MPVPGPGLEGIIEACPGGWNKIDACPGGIYKPVSGGGVGGVDI